MKSVEPVGNSIAGAAIKKVRPIEKKVQENKFRSQLTEFAKQVPADRHEHYIAGDLSSHEQKLSFTHKILNKIENHPHENLYLG